MKTRRLLLLVPLLICTVLSPAIVPRLALAADGDPVPVYKTLDELEGKRIAYITGSVYDKKLEAKVSGTKADWYPSLSDCIAAVEADKADAAVQLTYPCQLAVNRKGGTVAMLPEDVEPVEEAYFFEHGDPRVEEFNKVLKKFAEDGTVEELTKKWVGTDEDAKTLPEQDWDAPNGTLKFATSGVIEPLSYAGYKGKPTGYDVDLALRIAKELGYHLDVSLVAMDAIFASVESGKVDFGGALTNTPERAEMVDFTDQVMPCAVSVIVKAEEESSSAARPEISSFDELDGKTIGALNGGMYDKLMEKTLNGTFEFSRFNAVADGIAALKAGKIEAYTDCEPVCQLAVSRNEGVCLMGEPYAKDDYGFFFKKGSELTSKFNPIIERMWSDGTIEKLKAKWTGADEDAKTMPTQDWETPNGTLTMATSAQLEPLTYMRDGEVVGYDIEVALLICKELGYGLKIVPQDFPAMLAAVPQGKADFGGGAVSITDERKQSMDFSVRDYDGAASLVVREVNSSAGEGVVDMFGSLADSFRKTFVEEGRWRLIASGLGITILISVCSGVLGTLLGFGTVLARRSGVRWVSKLVDGYNAVIGGVPLAVVLMVLYYVVFGSMDIAGEIVAILAFTLAFGSVSGSTMWTAVRGMDAIQEECGLALGYTRRQVFRKIIFPQAAQQFLPQLSGQFVSLVKDTSVVGFIAVQDLTRASDLIRARTMDAFFPLISTAIIYFVFCRILAWALGKLVARIDITNKPRSVEGVIDK